jgi:hypothetical protein
VKENGPADAAWYDDVIHRLDTARGGGTPGRLQSLTDHLLWHAEQPGVTPEDARWCLRMAGRLTTAEHLMDDVREDALERYEAILPEIEAAALSLTDDEVEVTADGGLEEEK